MSYFIKKYEPNSLNEHSFNLNTVILLKKMIENDAIHVLIIGKECTGKTTLITNLINDYYQENHYDCVLKINNLNDQGMVFSRSTLTRFCSLKSTIKGKKKMICIDNYDNINENNQHILKSVIDKYQHNVHFVFSASSCLRISDSIKSRLVMTRLDYPTTYDMYAISKIVIEKEGIKISNSALQNMISISQLSITRLMNSLHKCSILGININTSLMRTITDGLHTHQFKKYIDFCKEFKYKEALNIVLSIHQNGFSLVDIFDELYLYIKTLNNDQEMYKILSVVSIYMKNTHNDHDHPLELIYLTNKLILYFKYNIFN